MKRLTVIALTMLLPLSALYCSAYSKVGSGNRLFKKGEFDKSLDKYSEAEMSAPENPAVYFNKGDALYKLEKYDEAQTEFNKSLASKDPKIKAKAYYNLGNSAFKAQKYDDALKFYKKALSLNPNDIDAKYNIEYMLNVKDKKQDNSKKDKNDKSGKDSKKEQQNAKNNKEEKDKAGGGEKQDKDKMSKEDAQRILQYFADQDKNSADKRKMTVPQLPKVEKDW